MGSLRYVLVISSKWAYLFSDVAVYFIELNEEYRTCYIRGTAEAAQMAESLIHEFITTQPIIEVHETWVPTVSKYN